MIRDNDRQAASLHRRGLAMIRNNRFAEAKALYADLCQLKPEDADAWYQLGTLAGLLGNIDEAGKYCHKAITLRPDHGKAHAALGNILFHQGNPEAAITHYQTALRINPKDAVAHNNLGNVLKTLGRLDEAIEHYKHAITVHSGYAVAHYNYGIALQLAHRLPEALRTFKRAVALNPNHAEAYNNLGLVFKAQNRLDEAKDALQRALAIKPAYAEAHYNLANIYLSSQQLDDAVKHFREAITAKPDYADAYNNLATVLRKQGQDASAIEILKQAIALDPYHAGAYNNLAIMLGYQGHTTEAVEMAQRALQIRSDFADAYNTLGNLRSWQGNPVAALTMFRRALELDPSHVTAHSNILMMMQYLSCYSAHDLLTAAADWDAHHARAITLLPPPANPPDPNRRLRIGYISADFCSHPVGYFIEGVIAHHDKRHCETFCYYNGTEQDAVTAHLQQAADHWRVIAGQADQSVAERIRQDGIDILVDLSGHTRDHRLLVFARRPAPVQLTWLGYFATTGLAAIDYILADRFVIPPAEEHHYTERVERLPHGYLCFTPPKLPIAIEPPPALRQGHVTFGCFNNPGKITSEVVACWSRLLHALPDARLKLKYKYFQEQTVTDHFRHAFAGHGIDAHRLCFEGRSPRHAYLEAYNDIDICLDPFPFNGCTTTMEALWMGTPVITRRWERFAGHMGDTILQNLDLADCIADSEDGYIEKAIALASDLSRLADLSGRIRDRLLASPLCDPAAFTRNLEGIYRTVWTRWCHDRTTPQG